LDFPFTLNNAYSARDTFEASETRDLFYRAAAELVTLGNTPK
jgi:hypothetical protein